MQQTTPKKPSTALAGRPASAAVKYCLTKTHDRNTLQLRIKTAQLLVTNAHHRRTSQLHCN
jgi:hypothetical protein